MIELPFYFHLYVKFLPVLSLERTFQCHSIFLTPESGRTKLVYTSVQSFVVVAVVVVVVVEEEAWATPKARW